MSGYIVAECTYQNKVQEEAPHQRHKKQYGRCFDVNACKVVTEILSRNGLTEEMRNFVRSLACGYKQKGSLDCCRQDSTTPAAEDNLESDESKTDEDIQESDEEETASWTSITTPQSSLNNPLSPNDDEGMPAISFQENVPCQTPDNQYGICMKIYSCKVVTDILSKTSVSVEMKSYIKSLDCGYTEYPLVCCPQEVLRSPDVSILAADDVQDSDEVTIDPRNSLTSLKCGMSNITVQKIVGGVPAKLGDFPWIVALGYENPKNPSLPRWACGGTLITAKHVITAAHCVKNDLILARIGELDLYDDHDGAHPVDLSIVSKEIHKSYDPFQATNDIAILTLAESTENIPGVWPICLPLESERRTDTYLNKTSFIAGWGAVYDGGPNSTNLLFASIPVVDTKNCAKIYGSRAVIDESCICAGQLNGDKDACNGDSGGPLMYGAVNKTEKLMKFHLIGVVSQGMPCGIAPGVYTRVTSFIDWIQQNID